MKVGVPALRPAKGPLGAPLEGAADIERGGMDNMIAAIRAGAAFRRDISG